MFKYELGQVVHYIYDSSFCSAAILSRQYVENQHDAWAHTKEQKALFTPWGDSGIYYSTCHGQFPEDHLYESREAMAIPTATRSEGK